MLCKRQWGTRFILGSSQGGERGGVGLVGEGDWGARGYIILYKGYLSTHYEIIYICSIFLVPTKFYDVTVIQHKHTTNTKELENLSNTLLLA